MNRSLLAHLAAAAIIAASVSGWGLGQDRFRSIAPGQADDGFDTCTSRSAEVQIDTTDRESRPPGPRPRQLPVPR